MSWDKFVLMEGGEIFPWRSPQGGEDANGTAFCGPIVFGQVFGTANSFRCCELLLLSVGGDLQIRLPLNGETDRLVVVAGAEITNVRCF